MGILFVAIASVHCGDAVLGERLACEGACEQEGEDSAQADASNDVACPVAPSPPACDGGVLPVPDDSGCVTGFRCVLACGGGGGRCLARSACAPPERVLEAETECATSEDQGCCLPSCPAIMAPPADFCGADETVTPVVDAYGCTRSFVCR